jgi:hypothetical protein
LTALGFQPAQQELTVADGALQLSGTRLDAHGVAEVVMDTAWEQLEGAALSLARSGAIKDRLTDAYRNHLALLEAEDLPDALRADFRACHAALTHERPLRGEDAVRATVRKMSNQEAEQIACTVVRMFAALARWAPEEPAVPDLPDAQLARAKARKAVPQVISLYAAEA